MCFLSSRLSKYALLTRRGYASPIAPSQVHIGRALFGINIWMLLKQFGLIRFMFVIFNSQLIENYLNILVYLGEESNNSND